jgi:hypothetical protein
METSQLCKHEERYNHYNFGVASNLNDVTISIFEGTSNEDKLSKVTGMMLPLLSQSK